MQQEKQGQSRKGKLHGLFYSFLTWLLETLPCGRKKFQELKWSMSRSHDTHLTCLPFSSASASFLSPELVWSHYHPRPSGTLFTFPLHLLWTPFYNWPSFVLDLNRIYGDCLGPLKDIHHELAILLSRTGGQSHAHMLDMSCILSQVLF